MSATVYKSVDDNGVVTFSDTQPPPGMLVETMVIDAQVPPPSDLEQQRLQDMRETTDRMASDRMAREKHRAEMRQLQAQTDAQQAAQEYPEYYDSSTIYSGYYNYPVRRPWRRPHHPKPVHPIARPPLRHPGQNLPSTIRPLPGNNYPASLIRRHYPPKVRKAFR